MDGARVPVGIDLLQILTEPVPDRRVGVVLIVLEREAPEDLAVPSPPRNGVADQALERCLGQRRRHPEGLPGVVREEPEMEVDAGIRDRAQPRVPAVHSGQVEAHVIGRGIRAGPGKHPFAPVVADVGQIDVHPAIAVRMLRKKDLGAYQVGDVVGQVDMGVVEAERVRPIDPVPAPVEELRLQVGGLAGRPIAEPGAGRRELEGTGLVWQRLGHDDTAGPTIEPGIPGAPRPIRPDPAPIEEESDFPHTPVTSSHPIAIVEARHDHGPPVRAFEDDVELDAERIRMRPVREESHLPGRPERQPAAIRDLPDSSRVRRQAHSPRHDGESLAAEPGKAVACIRGRRGRVVRPAPCIVPAARPAEPQPADHERGGEHDHQ